MTGTAKSRSYAVAGKAGVMWRWLTLLPLLVCLPPCASIARDFSTPAMFPQELARRMAGAPKPLVIDVRAPAEFRIGHVPGAVNLPEPSLEQHMGDLEVDRPIVLYCLYGHRTKLAEQLLIDHAITDLYHLDGGLNGWKDAGLPTVKGSGGSIAGVVEDRK